MYYLCRVKSAYNKDMDTSIINKVREFFKTKPIEKAWLFGSFSRGEEGPDSDVDILVTLTPDAHMGLSWFGMICDLEDLLNRPVDLVIEGDLLPFAKKTADKDKILIYERAA